MKLSGDLAGVRMGLPGCQVQDFESEDRDDWGSDDSQEQKETTIQVMDNQGDQDQDRYGTDQRSQENRNQG